MPSALKLVTGNPGRRPLNVDEPKPELALPDMPSEFRSPARAIARKEWKRISRELLALGLLTRIDAVALEMYCVAFDRWKRAERRMRQREELMHEDGAGEATKTPQGYPMQSVDLQISNRAREECLRMLAEFGMTPATRSRVTASPQLILPGLAQEGASAADRKWSAL